MADVTCTVPECAAQATLVLNGHPICRPHREEFAERAHVLDASMRDVVNERDDEARWGVAGQLPSGPTVVEGEAKPPS